MVMKAKHRFSQRVLSSRVDRIIATSDTLPDYANRALRPGSRNEDPSLETMDCFTAKPESRQYTGNEIMGIATMHKSNAVPVRKDSDMAVQISKMRR